MTTDENGNKVEAHGVTVMPKGWSRSSIVYLAQSAFESPNRLFAVMQHEFVHVALNYRGYGSEKYEAFQESIAYEVSSLQYVKFGMYWDAAAHHEKSQYYQKYVNFVPKIRFDYSSTIIHTRPKW